MREAATVRSLCTAIKRSPFSLQLEKICEQQGPSTTKTNVKKSNSGATLIKLPLVPMQGVGMCVCHGSNVWYNRYDTQMCAGAGGGSTASLLPEKEEQEEEKGDKFHQGLHPSSLLHTCQTETETWP